MRPLRPSLGVAFLTVGVSPMDLTMTSLLTAPTRPFAGNIQDGRDSFGACEARMKTSCGRLLPWTTFSHVSLVTRCSVLDSVRNDENIAICMSGDAQTRRSPSEEATAEVTVQTVTVLDCADQRESQDG